MCVVVGHVGVGEVDQPAGEIGGQVAAPAGRILADERRFPRGGTGMNKRQLARVFLDPFERARHLPGKALDIVPDVFLASVEYACRGGRLLHPQRCAGSAVLSGEDAVGHEVAPPLGRLEDGRGDALSRRMLFPGVLAVRLEDQQPAEKPAGHRIHGHGTENGFRNRRAKKADVGAVDGDRFYGIGVASHLDAARPGRRVEGQKLGDDVFEPRASLGQLDGVEQFPHFIEKEQRAGVNLEGGTDAGVGLETVGRIQVVVPRFIEELADYLPRLVLPVPGIGDAQAIEIRPEAGDSLYLAAG